MQGNSNIKNCSNTARKIHISVNGHKNDNNNKETPSAAKHDNEFTYKPPTFHVPSFQSSKLKHFHKETELNVLFASL